MTKEEKDLLLKDLSARLPYEPIVEYVLKGLGGNATMTCTLDTLHLEDLLQDSEDLVHIKPYLRPLSSMTEEEAKELLFIRLASKFGESCAYIKNFIRLNEVSFQKKAPYGGSIAVWFSFEEKIHDTSQTREYSRCDYLGLINDITLAEIDWLNAHHFDYRGLIPKGSAISTEVFNPYYN